MLVIIVAAVATFGCPSFWPWPWSKVIVLGLKRKVFDNITG